MEKSFPFIVIATIQLYSSYRVTSLALGQYYEYKLNNTDDYRFINLVQNQIW